MKSSRTRVSSATSWPRGKVRVCPGILALTPGSEAGVVSQTNESEFPNLLSPPGDDVICGGSKTLKSIYFNVPDKANAHLEVPISYCVRRLGKAIGVSPGVTREVADSTL